MPSIRAIVSASAVLVFSSVNAHLTLLTPAPYGSPNNSPLDPSGADFPCKAQNNADGPINEMAIGAPQELSFKGSAVHGGGSCQIALTKDNPATKSSKWMVIHSIEGGCPSKTATGNKGNDAGSTSSADKYQFTIPDGIDPGTYTLAWTWFNEIGQREMYMNCANAKVTGGSSKRSTYNNETLAIPELSERDNSFPDLFVANTPKTNCEIKEGSDVQFPDPGKSVERPGDPSKLASPTGPKCDAGPAGISSSGGAPSSSGGSGGGQGAGNQQQTPGASGAGAGSSEGSGAGSGAGSDSGSGAGAGSGAGSGADSGAGAGAGGNDIAAPSGISVKAAAASPAAAAAAAPSSVSTGASNSSGSSSTGATTPPTGSTSSTCTTPGQTICSSDGKQIGTCGSGTAVMNAVPAGTMCKDGLIQVIQAFRA